MADPTLLARDRREIPAIETEEWRLVAEPWLGVAKVQSLGADPALGVPLPGVCREVSLGAAACARLAPGEWLLTGPEQAVATLAERCRETMGGLGLVTDLTHARVSFELSGVGAKWAINAHCPLDLSDAAMPAGAATRSVFADTNCFIARKPDRAGVPVFRLIFDQTMAGYAQRLFAGTSSGMAQ